MRCLTILFAVAFAPLVTAQESFQQLEGKGQFRDAVIDAARGLIFAAVYDSGEVWVYNPATGERVYRIPTGQGPAALALSSEGVLACVNRLDDTLSLVRVGEAAPYATVATGRRPAAVAALPNGGFAVINAFDDSLSWVSAAGTVETITQVPSVPAGIAVSGNHVAVIGRVAAEIHLYAPGASAPATVIKLSEAPAAIEGMDGGTFAVATAASLLVIDAGTRAVTTTRTTTARSLAWDGAQLWSLEAGELVARNARLEEIARHPAEEGSGVLAARGGDVVQLAPALQYAYATPADATPVIGAVAATPEPAPAPMDEIVVAEAETVRPDPLPEPVVVEVETVPAEVIAPETAMAPEVAPPAEETPAPALEEAPAMAASASPPADEAREESVEEAEVIELDAAEADAGPEVAPAATPPGGFRRNPISTEGVRAPSTVARPTASPLDQLSSKTLTDALVHPTQFGSVEAGFIAPDWNEPLKDPQADIATFKGPDMDLEGNVKLRLGEMYFEADKFTTANNRSEFHAMGDVRMEQLESLLTASEMHYYLPDESALPKPTLLEPALDADGLAQKRLTLGRLESQNVYIDEPTRIMEASVFNYDLAAKSGVIRNTRGQAGMWYYGAEELVIHGEDNYEAKNLWITTCDHDPPHYRIWMTDARITADQVASGKNARLQIFNKNTPFFVPRWRNGGVGTQAWNLDFDSGRRAELGYFLNLGQRFEVSPDFAIGPRLFITEKEGVGFGVDADYDFTENPASRLYRSSGTVNTLYTTKDRGYAHWYHRWEHGKDFVAKVQVEHWGDENFYKDFYFEHFQDRTTPRSFANVTYRQPGYIATGTTRIDSHGWVRETEQMPEGTFHLLERPLADNLYLTFDTVNGYYNREPRGSYGARTANVARLTYSWDPAPGLSITPFVEGAALWYSNTRDDASDAAFSALTGVTAQSRMHREYDGFWRFEKFKHVMVPSITYSYRNDSNIDLTDSPRFDALDNINGASRIETKIDNVLYGRDKETSEVWQVGRLTLYQGNDFYNELSEAEDYEIEIDIRPRPWWGFQLVGERHVVDGELDIDDPFFVEQRVLSLLENTLGLRLDDDLDFNARFGDYNRLLTQFYYDRTALGGRFSGRLGFAYTETQDRVFNREILYGLGYRLNDKWGVGFEHRYDFEDGKFRTQSYEVRRRLHEWEAAMRFRDRESGFDIDIAFSLIAFPGSKIKF